MLPRMCCFSGRVTHVSGTRIFARGLADGRQTLAYSMKLGAPSDVAMILPIPVPDDVADDAVTFISLEGYETFFDDVERAFPPRFAIAGPPSFGAPDLLSLPVHRVGAFVASFVPRAADFARLDARFRLPEGVLDAFAASPLGFVVFALAEVSATPSTRQPMAFTFPRRDPRALFFPTQHVHDGTLPEKAHFDHTLYAQLDEDVVPAPLASGPRYDRPYEWTASRGMLAGNVDAIRARGVIDPSRRAFATSLMGELPNRDTLVA
jgi:hypothetical protein